jgi:hypothetical protein
MSLRSYIQDHPRLLVWTWEIASKIFLKLGPFFQRIGIEKASHFIHPPEKFFKQLLFDCRSCGQCILHYTGMTCPMTCPKQLRNGPCGGVSADGKCETDPEMDCVWFKALERIELTPYTAEKVRLNPPVDWQLEGLSSYVTYGVGRDQICMGNEEGVCYFDEDMGRRHRPWQM